MSAGTLIEIVLILGFMLYLQLGKKKVNVYRFLLPLGVMVLTGGQYLHAIPTDGTNLTVLIMVGAAAIITGLLLLASTKLLKEGNTFYTKTGLAYAIILVISFASRLGLEVYAENNRASFGKFLYENQINPDVIAPSFILFVAVMLLVRIIGLVARMRMYDARPVENAKLQETRSGL